MIPVRLALYTAAWVAAWVIGPHGPVYWDSPGYVRQALTGQVGGLALGRPLFVLVSHALARAHHAVGASVWTLEPFLRSFWLGVAALAAPFTHVLARACGLSERASLLAGLAVAASPAMAHTSDAVLTDAPSVAMAALSFALAALATRARAPVEARARTALALGAGAALGAAFGLREQAAGQLAVLALMVPAMPRGARVRFALGAGLGFVLVAGVPVAYVALTQRDYLHSIARWLRAMQRERSEHPYGARDALAYVGWLLALGPATLAFAALAWARHRGEIASRWTPALAVTVPSLVQLILLGGYQDIAYSPRYLLAALPGALAIPAGLALDKWAGEARGRIAAAVALLVLPVALAGPVVRQRERALVRTLATLPAALASVPASAVVVTGQPCPSVELVRAMARAEPGAWRGARPEWQWVCPGWSWPADLAARLDTALGEGRSVVLDLRSGSWLGAGQQGAMRRASDWASERASARREGRIIVWR